MALLSPRPLQQPYQPPRAHRRCTRPRCCSVALDAATPAARPGTAAGIRWGASKLQGRRSEMEDDLVLRPEGLADFAYAAVFDGHGGSSSVEFLREELYKECNSALQGGLVLGSKNSDAIRDAVLKAFEVVDERLLIWLEQTGKEVESGSTATVTFLRSDFLVVGHIGDSSMVISCGGKSDVVTNPHRPYGKSSVSLEEAKRIRACGGWISDGRVCGDLSVTRAFGDIRFKTKKNEMLVNGVKEGRWMQKFISRVHFKGDLVISTPDVYQIELGSDAELVILASDGLWDYLKSSEVVAFVRNQLRQHGDAQVACEALAHMALNRGSEDNLSIVIADLGRTDWQNLPFERPNALYELGQAFATIGFVSIGIWITTMFSL